MILWLTILLLSLQSVAQQVQPFRPLKEFRGDTVAYVKTNFFQRKTYYENKPLEVLLKDLGIPIRSYITIYPFADIQHFSTIMLSLWPWAETAGTVLAGRDVPLIHVTFDQPIALDSAAVLRRKDKPRGAWQEEEEAFFGSRKVKNIF